VRISISRFRTEIPFPEFADPSRQDNSGKILPDGVQAKGADVLDPPAGENAADIPPAEPLVFGREVSRIIPDQLPIDLHDLLDYHHPAPTQR